MSEVLTVKAISDWLETIAPLRYQESYDNSGLLTGSPGDEIDKALVSLDCTEAVIDEAIESGCRLIITHHPIIFRSLKRITGEDYIGRTLIKAIRNDIAIYALHTNLDNVYAGVNKKIASKLGLQNLRILVPRKGLLKKLVTYIPGAYLENVRNALFEAGAGHIGNYDECSYVSDGTGTFRGNKESNPFVGETGTRHNELEMRLEVIFAAVTERQVIQRLIAAHPYEEPAFDIMVLDNENKNIGAGMIGELPEPLNSKAFLSELKAKMATGCIRYTPFESEIRKVAICGGAGSFLLPDALREGADAFVTADFKYHEFFAAENRIMIADIGHYESEIFTKDLVKELILEKFPKFAVLLTRTNTNPIKYY